MHIEVEVTEDIKKAKYEMDLALSKGIVVKDNQGNEIPLVRMFGMQPYYTLYNDMPITIHYCMWNQSMDIKVNGIFIGQVDSHCVYYFSDMLDVLIKSHQLEKKKLACNLYTLGVHHD